MISLPGAKKHKEALKMDPRDKEDKLDSPGAGDDERTESIGA
ncbi:MAG: hypothetical protein AB7M93_30420 [Candidatus Obscuribacterales bacterium]